MSEAKGKAGFTLVEMLLCLTILVFLMAVFVPALPQNRARIELTSSAHDIALALRRTRDLAIAERRPEGFALDRTRRLYRGAGDAPRALAPGIEAELDAADADAQGGTIRFFADGGSSGGVLRLSLEKRRLDVVVDWLTGRISVERPRG